MEITPTNWLKLLKNDILARQTLYPNGGDVGLLTSTNWLKKLRDDILERQTLYPDAEKNIPLTKTNFLLLLRDDFLRRDDLFPAGSMSYMALSTLITAANVSINDTTISSDGVNVPTTSYWVTSGVRLVFYNAISAAQDILNNPDSTDSQFDAAAATLTTAMNTFGSARQPGTMVPPAG